MSIRYDKAKRDKNSKQAIYLELAFARSIWLT